MGKGKQQRQQEQVKVTEAIAAMILGSILGYLVVRAIIWLPLLRMMW